VSAHQPRQRSNFLPATTPVSKTNFWAYLNAALEYIPEAEGRQAIRGKSLAQSVSGPGKPSDIKALSPERPSRPWTRDEGRLTRRSPPIGPPHDRGQWWQLGSCLGDRAHSTGTGHAVLPPPRRAATGTMPPRPCIPLGCGCHGKITRYQPAQLHVTFAQASCRHECVLGSVTHVDGKVTLMIKIESTAT